MNHPQIELPRKMAECGAFGVTRPRTCAREIVAPFSIHRTLFTISPPTFLQVCPAGYNCGSGADLSTQFAHKCPAGLFCSAGVEPGDQHDSVCDAGYYCIRGTPNYLATQVLTGCVLHGKITRYCTQKMFRHTVTKPITVKAS